MTDPVAPPASVPPWSSTADGCRLVLRGVTFRTCARVAVVVGTILTLVNQGSIIVGGDTTLATWVRVGVNFLVPFIVSSIGYLAPFRCRSVSDPRSPDEPVHQISQTATDHRGNDEGRAGVESAPDDDDDRSDQQHCCCKRPSK